METNYELNNEIGRGSYGTVYEGTLDNEPVAVKVLHKDLRCDSIIDKFREECELLQRLNHKNIVKLIQFNISHSSSPVLITELLDCDLEKYITNLQPKKIPFPEIVSIMLDVAQGLHYLHYQCNPAIVHRDLASKNILLTKTRQAKIADLGLAKFFPRRQRGMSASPVPGTPVYAAPETWPRQRHKNPLRQAVVTSLPQVVYNKEIDIFSFGVVLMEAINGREPKCHPEAFDTAGRRIPESERRKDDIRQMGDHRLKELVLRCIEDESDERLNAKEVIDWLQKVKKSKFERKRSIALQRQPNKPPTLKIVTLGQSATGKTCIIRRLAENSFFEIAYTTGVPPFLPYTLYRQALYEQVRATIGIDYCCGNISVYGREFRVRVVDTAGHEKFLSLPPSYLRGAVGVLLVFDVTNKSSFEKGIPKMLELIHPEDDMRMILVGNKADAEDRRKVTRRQAEEFAANLGVLYYETSAVTGQNIHKVFEEITKVIYITSDLKSPVTDNALVLQGSQKEPTSGWCSWC